MSRKLLFCLEGPPFPANKRGTGGGGEYCFTVFLATFGFRRPCLEVTPSNPFVRHPPKRGLVVAIIPHLLGFPGHLHDWRFPAVLELVAGGRRRIPRQVIQVIAAVLGVVGAPVLTPETNTPARSRPRYTQRADKKRRSKWRAEQIRG